MWALKNKLISSWPWSGLRLNYVQEALAAEELCLQTLLTPHTGSR